MPKRVHNKVNPSESSICTFVLFDFYGISLQNKEPYLDTANWPVVKMIFRCLARVATVSSMAFLLVSTGSFAFTKDASAEAIANQTQNAIPALSTLNLKFYYRLSFHLKSYFCLLGYLYCFVRIKGKTPI